MLYTFQGLRSFKEKFKPQWEPHYLATPGGFSPALAIADSAALYSAALSNGGVRGIVGR